MPKDLTIDPGEGWRLLKPEEVVAKGDEYCCYGEQGLEYGWRESGNVGNSQAKKSSVGFSYFYRRRLPTFQTAPGGGKCTMDDVPVASKLADAPIYNTIYDTATGEYSTVKTTSSDPMSITTKELEALQGIADATPATKAKVQGMVHAAGFKSLLELAKSNYYRKEKVLGEIRKVVEGEKKVEHQCCVSSQTEKCCSDHSGDGYMCTMPKNHLGDHVACTVGEHNICSWPNLGDKPTPKSTEGTLGDQPAETPKPMSPPTDVHLSLFDVEEIAKKVAVEQDNMLKGDLVKTIGSISEVVQKAFEDFKLANSMSELIVKTVDGAELGRVIGARHKQFDKLLRLLLARNAAGYSEFILVWGAAGSGKTYLTRQLGEAMGVKSQAFPCGPTMTEGKLLGYNNVVNGEFVKGWLYPFYKDGGLAALDEIFLADPSVLAAMNSLEGDEFTFGNGERVSRHKDFHMIAFDNTIGAGATKGYKRNAADAATLNRLTYFQLEYDEDLERKVYGNSEWANYVIRVRKYVEANCNNSFYVTPRATRKGAAYLANGVPPKEVADAVLFGPCSKDTKASILKSVGVFGEAVKYGKDTITVDGKTYYDPLAEPASTVKTTAWHAKVAAMKAKGQHWNKSKGKFEQMSKFDQI